MTMLSYHNDANIKRDIVAEMQKHKDNDEIIKGFYRAHYIKDVFKGCAVGCAIHSFNVKLGKSYSNFSDHKLFEEAIGVPEWLAHLQDSLFEMLPEGEGSQFAVDFLDAIPVGTNLEPILYKFCSFILKENINRVSNLPNLSDEICKQVLEDIMKDLYKDVIDNTQEILELHEIALNRGELDKSDDAADKRYARKAAWGMETVARKAITALINSPENKEVAIILQNAAYSAATAAYCLVDLENARLVADTNLLSIKMNDERTEIVAKRYAQELIRLLKES